MGVSPVGESAFVDAVSNARDVSLTAFTLPKGPVLQSLKSAAQDGADVSVKLASDHFINSIPDLRAARLYAERTLRAAGASVHEVTDRNSPGHPLHAKLAIVDGVGYMNERNWPDDGMDIILRDDEPKDVAVIRKAIDGEVSSDSVFTTLKSDALDREADYIENGGGKTLDVETESFGPGVVADAIDARAKAGNHVRLIAVKSDVYGKDQHKTAKAAIEQLIDDGAEVRMNPGLGGEKMAMAGGGSAWIGSANATKGRPGTIDWGRTVDEPAVLSKMRDHFERTWDEATPYNSRAAGSA